MSLADLPTDACRDMVNILSGQPSARRAQLLLQAEAILLEVDRGCRAAALELVSGFIQGALEVRRDETGARFVDVTDRGEATISEALQPTKTRRTTQLDANLIARHLDPSAFAKGVLWSRDVADARQVARKAAQHLIRENPERARKICKKT